MSTSLNAAIPWLSVLAYSSTLSPESDVPDKRNVCPSNQLSSLVFTTRRLPRFRVLLKVTVVVCPGTTATVWDF